MSKKTYLLGYRDPSIKLYKTKIKPLGWVVVAIATIFLIIAIIPNGLGSIFYPLSAVLFGLVGIDVWVLKGNMQKAISKKINYIKLRYFKWN